MAQLGCHVRAVATDMTFIDGSTAAAATMLVYFDTALTANATQSGKIILRVFLSLSVGLLAFSNGRIESHQMFERSIKMVGKPKAYAKRLLLAEEMVGDE